MASTYTFENYTFERLGANQNPVIRFEKNLPPKKLRFDDIERATHDLARGRAALKSEFDLDVLSGVVTVAALYHLNFVGDLSTQRQQNPNALAEFMEEFKTVNNLFPGRVNNKQLQDIAAKKYSETYGVE